jgi:uncharacterized protein YbbC (DUF1343 family)
MRSADKGERFAIPVHQSTTLSDWNETLTRFKVLDTSLRFLYSVFGDLNIIKAPEEPNDDKAFLCFESPNPLGRQTAHGELSDQPTPQALTLFKPISP